MNLSNQRLLEELAFNAWPAAHVQQLDGWILRYTHGVTGRANSVWPNHDAGQMPLEEKLTLVEQRYRKQNLEPRFMLTTLARPKTLAPTLTARGYTTSQPIAVQTTAVETVLAHNPPKPTGFTLHTTSTWHAHWAQCYDENVPKTPQEAAVRKGIIQRISNATLFVSARTKKQAPAAIGLGIAERGWVGIFCMVTAPNMRRKGLAAEILRTLASWAMTQNAPNLYLQVSSENQPALALYSKLGFITAYSYHHYRLKF